MSQKIFFVHHVTFPTFGTCGFTGFLIGLPISRRCVFFSGAIRSMLGIQGDPVGVRCSGGLEIVRGPAKLQNVLTSPKKKNARKKYITRQPSGDYTSPLHTKKRFKPKKKYHCPPV